MRKLVFFIVSVLMISASSCSIEKRTYRKGYHVEWHNNKLVDQDMCQTEEPVEDSVVAISIDTAAHHAIEQCKGSDPLLGQQGESPAGESQKPQAGEKIAGKRAEDRPKVISRFNFQNTGRTQTDTDPSAEDQRELDPVSMISLVSGILAYVTLFANIYIAGPITVALFLVAIVCGIIGIVRTTAKRDKYKGKAAAIIGLVLGCGIILITFFVLLILIVGLG